MFEFGRVLWWNSEKNFGVVQCPSREELFFHMSNYKPIKRKENSIGFCQLRQSSDGSKTPERGDVIVFQRSEYWGSHPEATEKASPWGHFEEWEDAVDAILDRLEEIGGSLALNFQAESA